MPLISRAGRRSFRTRLLIGALYALLLAGSLSMVYPFLLMGAGSFKSGVDAHATSPWPEFLTDDRALFAKFAEGFFNESLLMMQMCLQTNASSFRLVSPPEERAGLAGLWMEFLRESLLPRYASQPSFIYTPVSRGTQPLHLRAFKHELGEMSEGRIELLNRRLGTEFAGWNSIFVMPQNYLSKRALPDDSAFAGELSRFVAGLPLEARIYFSVEGYYRWVVLRAAYPPGGIEAYNAAHGTSHRSWGDVACPTEYPSEAPERIRQDWLVFVRELLNPLWIRAAPEAAGAYRRYLAAKYQTIEALNRHYRSAYVSFGEVPLYEPSDTGSLMALSDWSAWISGWREPASEETHLLPPEHIILDSTERRFRAWLQERPGGLDALNAATGARYSGWNEVSPPLLEMLGESFQRDRAMWRREFVIRNYASVLDYILLHGRALFNTVVYCGLSILLALLVNPLAAYALSRYRPPSAYLALLFLMLTMAFPPMVTQIPSFLMLREWGLLNSFWALLLPGMANGYSIFLLKGFFDSLPRDLYDSAALDGAGELVIFWHITMSLSKPILAVIALNAFTLAYTNFMMALLICQDERMWTIMPWLYQLQQTSGPGVIYASLILAAIPTLLVFAFCQNIILRGIVVPVEK